MADKSRFVTIVENDNNFIEIRVDQSSAPVIDGITVSDSNIYNIDTNSDDFIQDGEIIDQDNISEIDSLTEVIYRKGYSPYINEINGFWYEWNEEIGGYVNTFVPATSASGSIPVIPNKAIDRYWFTKEVIR